MALIEELKSQGEFLFKHRSYLPLILLVAGLFTRIWVSEYGVAEGLELFVRYMEDFALVVGLSGLLIRIITVGYTPKNTSGRNTSEGQVADTLNTTGAYSLIRNPLYLGNYLMWLAISMLTGSIWFVIFFSLIFWIYYERIIFAEEAFLREKFGRKYLEWTGKVPPFLPRTLNWNAPDLQFSWKKVLKKEKNGLFALFLVFYIFEVVHISVSGHSIQFPVNWLLYATAITGMTYLVLKFLKRSTSLLDEEDR